MDPTRNELLLQRVLRNLRDRERLAEPLLEQAHRVALRQGFRPADGMTAFRTTGLLTHCTATFATSFTLT
jgi:hypothetical protein